MSANDQVNDAWELYVQSKKATAHRSVDEHNDKMSYERTLSNSRLSIMDLDLRGNLQHMLQTCRPVTMEDLFSPNNQLAKGPLLGGGARGPRSLMSIGENGGGSLSSSSATGGGHDGPTMVFVFEQWPQIKQMLWEIITSRLSEHDFPYLPSLFLDHFENTAKTGLASKRPFNWEEMEMVMSRFLETFLGLLQEEMEK